MYEEGESKGKLANRGLPSRMADGPNAFLTLLVLHLDFSVDCLVELYH